MVGVPLEEARAAPPKAAGDDVAVLPGRGVPTRREAPSSTPLRVRFMPLLSFSFGGGSVTSSRAPPFKDGVVDGTREGLSAFPP